MKLAGRVSIDPHSSPPRASSRDGSIHGFIEDSYGL